MGSHDFFFIGRHVGFPTALEGALKLKELTYLHAEGYPGGELKHGPLALIEPGVVVIADRDRSGDAREDALESFRGEGPRRSVVAVATDDDEMIESVADFVLRVPATEPMFTPWSTSFHCRCSPTPWRASWSKRRPAAEPRQDGDGRIVATVGVGIDVVDVPRFEIVLDADRESSSDSSPRVSSATPGAKPSDWLRASPPKRRS